MKQLVFLVLCFVVVVVILGWNMRQRVHEGLTAGSLSEPSLPPFPTYNLLEHADLFGSSSRNDPNNDEDTEARYFHFLYGEEGSAVPMTTTNPVATTTPDSQSDGPSSSIDPEWQLHYSYLNYETDISVFLTNIRTFLNRAFIDTLGDFFKTTANIPHYKEFPAFFQFQIQQFNMNLPTLLDDHFDAVLTEVQMLQSSDWYSLETLAVSNIKTLLDTWVKRIHVKFSNDSPFPLSNAQSNQVYNMPYLQTQLQTMLAKLNSASDITYMAAVEKYTKLYSSGHRHGPAFGPGPGLGPAFGPGPGPAFGPGPGPGPGPGSTTVPMTTPKIGSTTVPRMSETIGSTTVPMTTPIIGSTTVPMTTPIIGSTTVPMTTPIIGSTTVPRMSETIGSTTVPRMSETIGSTTVPMTTPKIGSTTVPMTTPKIGSTTVPIMSQTIGSATVPIMSQTIGSATTVPLSTTQRVFTSQPLTSIASNNDMSVYKDAQGNAYINKSGESLVPLKLNPSTPLSADIIAYVGLDTSTTTTLINVIVIPPGGTTQGISYSFYTIGTFKTSSTFPKTYNPIWNNYLAVHQNLLPRS